MKNFRSAKNHRGTQCLNCEYPLDVSDQYCPNCGQINSIKKLSFADFFNEFFAGLFAYDSRIRRTLATILFHPGKISRDYIRGKRMRFANPFRFYLSASIIFFLIWNFSNSFEGYNAVIDNKSKGVEELSDEKLEEFIEDLQKIPNLGQTTLQLDSLLVNKRETVKKSYIKDYISQGEIDSLGFSQSFFQQLKLYHEFYDATAIQQPIKAIDSLNHVNSTFNKWAYKKVVDFNTIANDPGIFLNYFLSKLPFIIFFYLPVFAFFIWLLYLRRPFNYMEHLIFTFHIQTTFFVFMSLAILIDFLFDIDFFQGLFTFLFLFYLYKAMRNFYEQGRFKTLVKFILLNGIFLILANIAAIFSLLASFAIY